MSIQEGESGLASDFINESERNATKTNDAGKVAKLESDGYLDPQFIKPSEPIIRIYNVADSPATWTKPTGLKHIIVEVLGAGGGGGGTSNNDRIGQSAGAGGYAKVLIPADDLGATETATIGSGGSGGSGYTNGGNGGDSSFTRTTGDDAVGNGGYGGQSETTGNSGAGGGSASGGDLNINGGQGNGGSITSDRGWRGAGGSTIYGQGGIAQFHAFETANGDAGQGYGSGGSGGYSDSNTDSTGGAGADGVVIVTEYYV